MTPDGERLLIEALRLSEEDRGELAARLIDSLEPGVDCDDEAHWDEEIRRRIEELDSGQVQAIPWPEARRLILEDADQ